MITIRGKFLLFAALAGAMLSATHAQAQARPEGTRDDRQLVDDGFRGRGAGPCLFGPRMMEALGMTESQRAAVDRLGLAAQKDVDALGEEIVQEEGRLTALRGEPEKNARKIAAVINNLNALEKQIDDRWREFREDVLDLFTKEQLAVYNRYYSRGYGPGADDLPGWGRGRGTGYGRGYGRGYGPGYGPGARWWR